MRFLNNLKIYFKTRGRIIFIFLFSFSQILIQAQDLLKSEKTSHYTYIFKISDAEAKEIYSKKEVKIDRNFFHTVIDSFLTGMNYDKKLAPGHYLKIYSIENIQVTEIASVQNIEVFLLNNFQDLTIQIYDLQGNIIKNAEVKIKNSQIKYNEDIKAYRHRKSNKNGLLKVTHNEITTYYAIEKEYKNSAFKRGSRKVLYNTPLKYIWTPVEFVAMLPVDAVKSISSGWSQGSIRRAEDIFERIYKGVACIFDDYQCGHFSSYKRNIHHGYFVFNKPKYKPGDTIKFKSYVVDRKGKPLSKPLSVILSGNNLKIELTKLNPYDEGGYEFEFMMHDSIKPVLDTYYSVRLEDDKDNSIISKGFRYEDYELKKNKLTINIPQKNQYKNTPFEVFVVATDDNDLTLKDARIEVLLRSHKVEKLFHDFVFIPDSLGYFEQKLEPIVESKIIISDSLFPEANFAYNIEVKLLTSDNEIISTTEKINYHFLSEKLEADVIKDSIYFWHKKNGFSTNRKVLVYGMDNFGNETLVFSNETPAQIKLNSFYSSYIAKSDNLELKHNVFQQPSLVEVIGIRTADSVKFEVLNPRNLFFNYNIFLKNNLLLSGYSKYLKIDKVLHSKENYQISLQYIWGGKVENKNISIPLKDKLLNVEVNQPGIVYPGQRAKVALRITDYKGKPVEGVDLTAYSVTKKLNHFQPDLPYLGDERKNRNIINLFSFNEQAFSSDLEQELDVTYWNSLARIDSIEYYKYLYPKNDIYQYAFTPNDSITQFSPFVFSNGKRVPIHVIYVDNKPVYFSWSTNEATYSFKIRKGYHEIKLRTTQKLITIDSLFFPENKKLIFSLDTSISRDGIAIQNIKPYLSESEKGRLYNYILPYKINFRNRPAYLENDGQTQFFRFNHIALIERLLVQFLA